jgi:hypothetical protein
MGVTRELRAGPLSLLFEEGGLRYVRLGRHEVLRRIYVAVRDRNWDTVPTALSNLRIDADAQSFRATFDAGCRRGEIDFTWKGAITGNPQGIVRFALDGVARSTFLRNRIGICVLHPIRECAGRPCTVEHTDGSTEPDRFPEDIAPHQPFKAVRSIAHEVTPGVVAEVRFQGDVFETEDQRNWTDASFKTYSTPLELPFPAEVKEGTRVSQTVTLSLRGAGSAPLRGPGPITFTVGNALAGPFPKIGLCLADRTRTPNSYEAVRLQEIHISHLRADLARPEDFGSSLWAVVTKARLLHTSLELALHLSGDAPRELERLARTVADMKASVSSFLLFDSKWIPPAREALRRAAPSARIGAGTNLHFAELNRNRPPVESIDFLFHSLNPQVHASDNATLIENLEAQGDTVRSSRRFSGGRPVAVTPVTLRPRFNPHAGADTRPPPPDERQKTLFGAAWTVGSLKSLAESGASSVTFYEDCGPRGILEGDRVFPLYHVLADTADFASGEIIPASSSDPLALTGLALRKEGRTRILLANLTDGPLQATLENIPSRLRIRRLNGGNARTAAVDVELFRVDEGTPTESRGGRLELDLFPFEFLRIDSA